MSKRTRKRTRRASEIIEIGLSATEAKPLDTGEVNTPATKRSRFWMVGVVGFVLLLTLGVFARNDWFPRTDGLSGKKYGWFGKELARNATSTWNPLSAPPPPSPTQLSKEYIYAGSRLLAVEDANANAVPPADIALWRPSNGTWYILNAGYTSYAWGQSGDVPVQADYDGDGKTDFAIWRPGTTAVWYIVPSSTGSYYTVNQGQTDDIPTVADFDGDGKSDLVLYRPSDNKFYVIKSSGGTAGYQWGANGDIPAPHDYDGDGMADYAVWRPSNATFYAINSSNPSTVQEVVVGANGDKPVPADYDGDGKADFATFKTGTWKIRSSSTGITTSYAYGGNDDIPVQNDYDGDGKCDRAIFRPIVDASQWWIWKSSTNSQRPVEYFGTNTDIPVPAYYRR